MRKLLCLLLSVLFLLPLCVACTEPDPYEGMLVLAKDGVSDYRIVVPAGADETMVATAAELQSYLRKICGVLLDVVEDTEQPHTHEILIGDTNRVEGEQEIDRSSLGKEGFVIRNVGNNIFITGREPRGTLYGVYGFLEEYLGVRYWAEGEEHIPFSPTLAIAPFEENRQKPGFEFRLETHQSAASFNEKQRLNGAWSGDKQPIAGGIEYSGPWYVHTFGSLLGWESRERYCKQPCLSDPGILNLMYEAALEYLAKAPEASVIAISQNDSTLENSGECTCSKCTEKKEKYGSSGAMLLFINELAVKLQSRHPDVKIETLAYYYTQEPPKGGVVPHDNVIVRFCNAGGCMMHSLLDEEGMTDSEAFYVKNNALSLEYLKGWAEITDNLYIWDYNIDFGSTLTTIPNFDRLYDNITTYKKLGVTGIYMQGLRDGGEFDRLRGYLASKLMWNPRMTYEEYRALMVEFLVGYYGPGGEDILAYIDYLAELCANIHPSMYHDYARFMPFSTTTDAQGNVVPDTTALDKMKAFWDAAFEKADTYEQRLRIERTYLPVLYYETLLHFSTMDETGETAEEIAELNRVLHEKMLHSKLSLLKEGVAIPTYPNYKNSLLYWGWDGAGIFDKATEEAHLKAKEEAEKNEAGEGADTSEGDGEQTPDDEPIDVTDAYDSIEDGTDAE